MTKISMLAASALVAALAVPLVASAQTPTPAPVPQFKADKCYGIAKAGKNDCQTVSSSCAGTSRRDGQADAGGPHRCPRPSPQLCLGLVLPPTSLSQLPAGT